MPNTIQIPGRFRYHADVIPKGSRNPRRALMHAPTLYEIQVAEDSDVERDAILIRTWNDVRESYTLHAGRLWRPANPANPTSLDMYRRHATDWPTTTFATFIDVPAEANLRHDPVANTHNPIELLQWPDTYGMTLAAEEDFQGRILSSNREYMRVQCEASASHVLLIDDEVHFATPEPLWTINDDGSVRLVSPRPGRRSYNHGAVTNGTQSIPGWLIFNMGRSADAAAYAELLHPGKPHPAYGDVLVSSPSFRPPHDLTRPLHYALPRFLVDCHAVTPHLSPDSFAIMGQLQHAANSASAYGLGTLDDDPIRHIDGMRFICTEIGTTLLPEKIEIHRKLLLETAEPLMKRASFESSRNPTFSEADDMSIIVAGGMT